MSYATSSGMKSGRLVTTKASAAETSSTTHGSLSAAAGESSVLVTVAVTAGSGTPTMTVVVEGSPDGTNWFTLGVVGLSGYSVGVGTAPSNFTGAATSYGAFPIAPFVRTRSVIGGGTPSLTYSVTVQVV